MAGQAHPRRPGSASGGPGTSGRRPGTAPARGGSGWRPATWAEVRRAPPWTVAAVLLVAVVAAGLLAWRPWTRGGAESAFSFREGRFVQSAGPWHLIVSAGPAAPDAGCTVDVRDETRAGPSIASPLYPSRQDNVILQVSRPGSFYLDYPDGCLVTATGGRGDGHYPVRIPAGVGDSLGWNPSGPVEITADGSGTFPCEVSLVRAETGGVEVVTLTGADDLATYDTPDTSSLFMRLSGTDCFVTARDASSPGS